jgi:regulator of RNase E activity RraA
VTPSITRTINRADAGAIARLGECGVATVHEAQKRAGLLAPVLRPIYGEARVAGSAVTVLCGAGDNLMIVAREMVPAVVAAANARMAKEAATRAPPGGRTGARHLRAARRARRARRRMER